ncbi:MAG: ATP-grasp domain-containing protein [Alkalispirochaeta sp.]
MKATKGSIFLLGGGLMQLPAIEEAKHLGLVRHLADGNSACPGRERVESFHHVDLRDTDRLLEVARTIPDLRGVFTAGTDFSRSVAYVAEQLGLPGITREVAERATDKGLMRETLARGGVNVPRYRVFHDGSEPEPTFPLPWVVKPVDNMGARGVILVHSRSDLDNAVRSAREFARSKRVIVEEYIPGEEYSLDALIYDGTVRITGIGARHIFFRPRFVELGHTIPARLNGDEYRALVDTFTAAIHAIGIDRGAAKGDIFLDHDNDGVPFATVGEVAARLSGGFMSGWTFPLATGIPLTRLGIEVALGESPEPVRFSAVHDLVSAERALISAPGTVRAIETSVTPVSSASGNTGVREVFINCTPGDRVVPPRNNVEKVANVIALGADADEAARIAADALDRIVVVLVPGDRDSDTFFFRTGWDDMYARYRVAPSCETRRVLSEDTADPSDLTGTPVEPIIAASLKDLGGSIADLENNQISISPSELVDRLVLEGQLELRHDADRDRSILFWRSLIAGGRQGVRYFSDTAGGTRRNDG